MNNCLLCFLIVFLIIIFFIILGFCTTNNEPFTSIAPEYKEQAVEIIRKQVKSFNKGSFSVALLQDYHQKNMESCAYIEINSEGDYRINYSNSLKGSDKIAYLSLLMKKVKERYKKLPQCVFVQSFADRQVQQHLCILENSALDDERALLSPLWYYFSKAKIDQVMTTTLPWTDKKPVALWRGATTGFSMNDFRSGKRVSRKYIVDRGKDSPDKIDARFTSFADKGKHLEEQYNKSVFMTPPEQQRYKYIISTDGNGGTYGLYWVLSSGSLCLNNSFYKQWFTPFFQKDKHYVTFDDSQRDSLEETVVTVRERDTRSLRIALNAKKTAKNIFNEDFVVFYMYTIIEHYAQRQNH